jgi:hypothetical protein
VRDKVVSNLGTIYLVRALPLYFLGEALRQHKHHGRAGHAQRDGMATFNKERVEHALNELLVRIIPDDPDEDEATANQRFEEAFDFAIDELETAPNLTISPDINHVASSIDGWSKAF